MRNRTSWVFVLVLFGAGCRVDKSSNSPIDGGHRPSLFQDLGVQGNWESGCLWQPEKRLALRSNFSFNGNRYTYHLRQFTTEQCTAESQVTDLAESAFDSEPSAMRLEGWTSINFIYESLTLTITEKAWAKNYNDKRAYERDDWALNESRDISGRRFQVDRPIQPFLNQVYERTFKINGDEIVMADYKDGNMPYQIPGNALYIFHRSP